MIREVTQNLRNVRAEINKYVGQAFSFFEKIKEGRIGSQGFDIYAFSDQFAKYFESDNTTHRCNIELRKNGILIGFRYGYRSYVWGIPFSKISFDYNDDDLTVSDGHLWLKVTPSYQASLDRRFLKKIELRTTDTLNK